MMRYSYASRTFTSRMRMRLMNAMVPSPSNPDEFIKQVYGEEETAANMFEQAQLSVDDQAKLVLGLLARVNLAEDASYKSIASTLITKLKGRSEAELGRLLYVTQKRLHLINKYLEYNGKEIFGSEFEY